MLVVFCVLVLCMVNLLLCWLMVMFSVCLIWCRFLFSGLYRFCRCVLLFLGVVNFVMVGFIKLGCVDD